MNSKEIYIAVVGKFDFLMAIGYAKNQTDGVTNFESLRCKVSVIESRYGERPEIFFTFYGSDNGVVRSGEIFWYFLENYLSEWRRIVEGYRASSCALDGGLIEALVECDILRDNAWIFTDSERIVRSRFFDDMKRLNIWQQERIGKGLFPGLEEILEQINILKKSPD